MYGITLQGIINFPSSPLIVVHLSWPCAASSVRRTLSHPSQCRTSYWLPLHYSFLVPVHAFLVPLVVLDLLIRYFEFAKPLGRDPSATFCLSSNLSLIRKFLMISSILRTQVTLIKVRWAFILIQSHVLALNMIPRSSLPDNAGTFSGVASLTMVSRYADRGSFPKIKLQLVRPSPSNPASLTCLLGTIRLVLVCEKQVVEFLHGLSYFLGDTGIANTFRMASLSDLLSISRIVFRNEEAVIFIFLQPWSVLFL